MIFNEIENLISERKLYETIKYVEQMKQIDKYKVFSNRKHFVEKKTKNNEIIVMIISVSKL